MTEKLEKILLVDDDDVTNLMHRRRISRRSLARCIDIATDGQAALNYLVDCAENNLKLPDLVLLDINMPGMNGFEFLDAFKELPATVTESRQIVMVSTSSLRRDRARADFDKNVMGYETKPLSDLDFERIVSQCQQSAA